MSSDSLAGCRILVVEDETLIAMSIEETLQDLGCIVVGPVSKLQTALRLAGDEALDAAILDVTIRGGQVYPVAEQLLARGIPFVLASGYGDWALPQALQDQPRLTKPFTRRELEEHVRLLERALPLPPSAPTVERGELSDLHHGLWSAGPVRWAARHRTRGGPRSWYPRKRVALPDARKASGRSRARGGLARTPSQVKAFP